MFISISPFAYNFFLLSNCCEIPFNVAHDGFLPIYSPTSFELYKAKRAQAMKCNIFGFFESKRRHTMSPSDHIMDQHGTMLIKTELCTQPSDRWQGIGCAHVI
jgi:hypothetical protein